MVRGNKEYFFQKERHVRYIAVEMYMSVCFALRIVQESALLKIRIGQSDIKHVTQFVRIIIAINQISVLRRIDHDRHREHALYAHARVEYYFALLTGSSVQHGRRNDFSFTVYVRHRTE